MKPRPRAGLVGPLGGWELVRLARKGHGHRARLLVVYFLFAGFVLTPILWFPFVDPVALFTSGQAPITAQEAAAFGSRFATVLMEAVLLAVAAMTPGYAAAAIAEEKERGTLELLLTTPLTDREIVLGKAVGRCGFVLGSVLVGLPVLAATAVLGGVSLWVLLPGCGLIASTTVLATAIGINAGCLATDLRGAVLRAYGTAAVFIGGLFVPPCVLVSPFGILYELERAGGDPNLLALGGVGYPIVQLLFAGALLIHAVGRLRGDVPPPRPIPAPRVQPDPYLDRVRKRDRPRHPDYMARIEPVADYGRSFVKPPSLPRVDGKRPLLWKERYVTGRKVDATAPGGAILAKLLFGGLGVLLVLLGGQFLFNRVVTRWAAEAKKPPPPPVVQPDLLAAAAGATAVGFAEVSPPPPPPWNPAPDEGGRVLMTGGVVFSGLFLIPTAVGLAAAVARERHRKTLDALLAIPFDRRDILRAKVRAVVERGWWWCPLAVAATGFGFGADGGWLAGVAAAGYVAAGSWLVVGLGVWLTVRCPTELRALRFLVPVVVVVVGAPVGAWNATDWYDASGPAATAARLGLAAVGFALAGTMLWNRAGKELDRLG